MKVIHDSDVTVYTDKSGDTLTLIDCPRQRDLMKSIQIEKEAAFADLEDMKKAGYDLDKIMAEAKPEDIEKARDNNNKRALPLEVRRFRLKAVAVKMVISGETFGGDAIVDQYDLMDADSVSWVDEQVEKVWSRATPDDASRQFRETLNARNTDDSTNAAEEGVTGSSENSGNVITI